MLDMPIQKKPEDETPKKKVKSVQLLRGFRDILPEEEAYWSRVEEVVARIAQDYSFGRIRLPILEQVHLFERSVGKGSDIIADSVIYTRNAFLDNAQPHKDDSDAIVHRTPTNLRVVETDQHVSLVFKVDKSVLNAEYPIVDNNLLSLPFSFDAAVNRDFFRNNRKIGENVVGPFVNINPGINEFVIYKYPELYKKALSLIGEKQR